MSDSKAPTEVRAHRLLLIASESPWPTTNGVRTKVSGFATHFPGRVDLVCPADPDVAVVPPRVYLSSYIPQQLRFPRLSAVSKGLLPIASRLSTDRILSGVSNLLDSGARYDMVHLDTMATAHLIAPLRAMMLQRGLKSTIVVSLNDSYSFLLASGGLNDRLPVRVYRRYVQFVERRLLPSADAVDVVSERDSAWLTSLLPSLRVRIIPLGVDANAFSGPRLQPEWDVLYLGAMSAHAFHWLRMALDSALPRMRETLPAVRVATAGPEPVLAAKKYFLEQGVQYLGFVDDLSALLRSSRVLLVSSRQRAGTPTKALQAMAAGTPVVGMEALDGIPNAKNDVEFSRANSWVDLAARLCAVLSDDSLANTLRENGRRVIQMQHDWRVVCDRYIHFDLPSDVDLP